MELTAQGDFGPHTQVRITEWIENVPVKDLDGRTIGRAKIGENGVIHAVIDETNMSKELFDMLRTSMSSGLSIGPHTEPVAPEVRYSEEIRRRFDEANAPHKKEK